MPSVDDLCSVLRSKVGYETVKKFADSEQIVLIGRMLGPVDDLLIAGHQLQVQALDRSWTHEIAKIYPLKGRKLVHAWRLVFEAPNVQDCIGEFIKIIGACPKARRTELTSVELPGGNRYRATMGKNGKGAALMGQAHVGPAALLAHIRGNK